MITSANKNLLETILNELAFRYNNYIANNPLEFEELKHKYNIKFTESTDIIVPYFSKCIKLYRLMFNDINSVYFKLFEYSTYDNKSPFNYSLDMSIQLIADNYYSEWQLDADRLRFISDSHIYRKNPDTVFSILERIFKLRYLKKTSKQDEIIIR